MLSKNVHLLSLNQKPSNSKMSSDTKMSTSLNQRSNRSLSEDDTNAVVETVEIDWEEQETNVSTEETPANSDEPELQLSKTFEGMGLNEEVLECVFRAGLEKPTKPQRAVKTIVQNNKTNVIVNASTGSGKTIAFLLPVAHSVNTGVKQTQVIIVAPSRDLATQIFKECKRLFGDSSISTALHRGTRPKDSVQKSDGAKYMTTHPSHKGKEHIVIGTPGRLLHLLHEETYCDRDTSILIDTRFVHQIVLDECDKQLATSDRRESDMSRDVHEILDMMPSYARQLLFSATMSTNVKLHANNINAMYMEFQSGIKNNVDHYYVTLTSEDQKGECLRHIISEIANAGSTFVFASSILKVRIIYEALLKENFSVDLIHATLTQRERDTALENFKSGATRILVATNVVARGIDITSVDLVFNYDLNRDEDTEEYVHRSGRAGRIGKHGISIIFVVDNSNSRPADIVRIEREQTLKINQLPELHTLR